MTTVMADLQAIHILTKAHRPHQDTHLYCYTASYCGNYDHGRSILLVFLWRLLGIPNGNGSHGFPCYNQVFTDERDHLHFITPIWIETCVSCWISELFLPGQFGQRNPKRSSVFSAFLEETDLLIPSYPGSFSSGLFSLISAYRSQVL